jgi:biotin carboxyl carrier protein
VKYFVVVNGRDHVVDLVERPGKLEVLVDGRPLDLDYHEVDELGQVVLLRDGRSYALSIEGDESRAAVTLAGHFHDVRLEDERERAAHAAERSTTQRGGVVSSVMPGVVVDLLVKVGDRVEKGQPLLILSAMKMQNEVAAPAPGVVSSLHVAPGEPVGVGARLVTLG